MKILLRICYNYLINTLHFYNKFLTKKPLTFISHCGIIGGPEAMARPEFLILTHLTKFVKQNFVKKMLNIFPEMLNLC